jgi:hypothetical protein
VRGASANHDLVVRFVCGHEFRIPRDAGVVDPQSCTCVACHPRPVHDDPSICPSCLGMKAMVLTLDQPCCALGR